MNQQQANEHSQLGTTAEANEAAILLRQIASIKPSQQQANSSKQEVVPTVSVEGAPAGHFRHAHSAQNDQLQVVVMRGDEATISGEQLALSASNSISSQVTSDVNSLDDAASIASRLSQIVTEEEFRLVHGQQLERPKSYKSANSLGVRSKRSALKQNKSFTDLDKLSTIVQPEEVRIANEEEYENEAPISISGGGGGCANRPERGNIKTLESSRQSMAASNNRIVQTPDCTMRCVRSNSLGRANDELMLNIRRSAWTLDEFEQTFKPNENSVQDAGSYNSSESVIEQQQQQQQNESSQNKTLANQQHFERQSAATSSGRNLLIRASRNAMSQLSGAGSAAASSNSNNNNQPTRKISTGTSATSITKERRFSQLELPPAGGSRRPSRAISISDSIASSLDSCRSGRLGFGRFFGGHALSKSGATPTRDDKPAPADSRGCCQSLATLRYYLPILQWLPAYKPSECLWGDLTAGLAVAVLNISTSLSAAVVAQTELGAAFRSSIVNTLVYALLCSSRHTSFGSWSIMSQMLLDSVRRALSDELILNRINLGPQAAWNADEYELWHMHIIIMYTFLIGLVQLMAGLLNLGNILASFIPEALCSSMIAATAFTMAIGQLANMCGTSNKILNAIERNTTQIAWADLKNPPSSITDLFAGLFRWMKQIRLLIKHHEQINSICLLISLICVLLLFFNQSFLQTQLRKLFKKKNLFIPFELILLISMIIISHLFQLKENPYNVPTCGPISLGLGLPNVPNLRLVRELWFDSLATALISYTMVFIMAKTYSNKFNYEVDGNQELIACGAGNLIGGLFDALPATASFSRTAGQVEAGGQTQMASLINCLVLFVVAQWLGEHVALLPVCVMSATLFFGFVRMMTRTREALLYWRICKVDFAIWMVTYVAILTLDLVNGFVYGFIFSILTMLYRAQNRRCYMLGSIGQSLDVYVPLAKYPLARELPAIKIFQFCGPIHYVSADLYERLLRQKTRVNVKQILAKRAQLLDLQQESATKTVTQSQQSPEVATNQHQLPSHIILDFSMISFIDSAGVHVIRKIIQDYQQVNITVMLTSLASHVAAIVKNEPTLWAAHKDRFYVTLTDAVHHALRDSTPTTTATPKLNSALEQIKWST